MNFKILVATEEHVDLIANFQMKMALESENLELDKETVTRGVKHIVDNPQKGQYLLASSEEGIAGSLLVLEEWSDWRCKTVLWIHSAYVTPKSRGQGAFRALYAHLKNKVEVSPDLAGLRLYVDKSNHKAKNVYQKLGMTDEHYELYEWLN